ncbi:MAG: hypothetical protein AAF264_05865 [Pseudomonadota bacterium]
MVLFEEDRIVEWATVVAFAATGLFGLLTFWRSDRRNLVLLAVALIGWLGALDELSFGERVFQFEAPRILGAKVDSAHDLLLVARTAIYRLAGSYQYALAAMLLVLGLAAGWGVVHAAMARGWTLGRRALLILPVAATAAVALAQTIDVSLDLIPYKMLQRLYVEEVLELAAGILLLGYVRLWGES